MAAARGDRASFNSRQRYNDDLSSSRYVSLKLITCFKNYSSTFFYYITDCLIQIMANGQDFHCTKQHLSQLILLPAVDKRSVKDTEFLHQQNQMIVLFMMMDLLWVTRTVVISKMVTVPSKPQITWSVCQMQLQTINKWIQINNKRL